MAKDPYKSITDQLNKYNQNATNKMTSYTSEQEGALGLPTLRSSATNLLGQQNTLEKSLSDLPKVMENQSRGFDVNADQLGMITNEKATPLRGQLSDVSRAYGTTANALGTAENTLSSRLGNYMNSINTGYGTLKDTLMTKLQSSLASKQAKTQAKTQAKYQEDLLNKSFAKDIEKLKLGNQLDINKYWSTKDNSTNQVLQALINKISGQGGSTGGKMSLEDMFNNGGLTRN